MDVVVDTNVPVVANGRSSGSPACVNACIKALRELTEKGILVLDDKWRIISEYQANLSAEGQSRIGDRFLKWVLRNRANPARCHLVSIRENGISGFDEFPSDNRLTEFDPSDRKFVAVAVAHPNRPPILQALDSGWWNYKEVLEENGVTIQFLCPQEIADSAEAKRRRR